LGAGQLQAVPVPVPTGIIHCFSGVVKLVFLWLIPFFYYSKLKSGFIQVKWMQPSLATFHQKGLPFKVSFPDSGRLTSGCRIADRRRNEEYHK
jgi:hypothetical protein